MGAYFDWNGGILCDDNGQFDCLQEAVFHLYTTSIDLYKSKQVNLDMLADVTVLFGTQPDYKFLSNRLYHVLVHFEIIEYIYISLYLILSRSRSPNKWSI